MAVTKAGLALLAGIIFIRMGFGAVGVLSGLLLGFLVPMLGIFRRPWQGVRLGQLDREILKKLLKYGLPLTGAFILDFIVNSSDRMLLVYLVDSAASGLYAVGYDLPKRSLWILMMIVNLAAYPLVVRALEQQGPGAARDRLRDIAVILAGIGLPGAAGLWVLAPNLAGVLVGNEFQDATTGLIPWIALAILLAGLKAYYLDLAFQLGRRTMGQVWVLLVAAVLNLGLNLWWIPVYGYMGAAYSTVAAYAAGFMLSGLMGRRVFPLPLPWLELGKIVLAVVGMSFALWPFAAHRGAGALAGQITWGIFIYGILLLLLNVGQIRNRLAEVCPGRRS